MHDGNDRTFLVIDRVTVRELEKRRNDSRAQESFHFMMDNSRNPHLEGAIQTLVWAIEEIVKTGNKEAEHHARLALKHLQPPNDQASSRERR
ncbi:hypothetical protein [Bradyrhizobium sp. Cp5.3]|uniref:hypothetical protein n=1 Tax=Bradyrhizobium sp. Cp5.3 TaxID=443598 RepID=UPI0005577982|nr:hypothetical protein [Bradyrhizobium sp. Cp5.3]